MPLRMIVLLVIACLSAALPMQAQYDPIVDGGSQFGKLYVGGTYGYFYDFRLDEQENINNETFVFDFKNGDQYHLNVGTYLGNARAEFEVGYFETTLDQIDPNDPSWNDRGSVKYLTLMFNGYIDFLLVPAARNLEGYVGGGLGVAQVRADMTYDPPFTFTDGTSVDELNDTEWAFAYQFKAGLTYHLTPNVALTGGYRVRWIGDIDFDNSQQFKSEPIQSIDFGVRVTF